MISTSEVCVSVVVDEDRGEEALGSLRKAFHISIEGRESATTAEAARG